MKLVARLISEMRLISVPILVVCFIYVVFGASFFLLFGDNQTKLGGLSSNLFAGSIDTFLAVILISYIIARNSRNQHRPMRYAAYMEAQSATRILLSCWFDMIKASSLELPPVGEDLLQEKYFDAVANHLDLDRPCGIMDTTWLARATSTGVFVKDKIEKITSRYSAALSPEILLHCTEFEDSGMIKTLASIMSSNTTFTVKVGITMQKPFFLKYSKESIENIRNFIAMVHKMSKEFENERGYIPPVSFVLSPEMAKGHLSLSELSSAYVE